MREIEASVNQVTDLLRKFKLNFREWLYLRNWNELAQEDHASVQKLNSLDCFNGPLSYSIVPVAWCIRVADKDAGCVGSNDTWLVSLEVLRPLACLRTFLGPLYSWIQTIC